MRNRALHDALRNFALEAAARLVRANDGGAEIEFALDERNEGSATLYRYRPLTAEFIAARWLELRGSPGFEPAARALGTGARSYLRRRGEPGADAEPALRVLLERLYEDSTSFAFPEERFERVYEGVERALYAGTVHMTIVAPLFGLRLEGARVELSGDLSLVDVALLAPAPSPAWLDHEEERGGGSRAAAYLMLERDLPSDGPLPLGEARGRFGAVLLALRMLERGSVELAPLGFSRVGDARWQPLRLDPAGPGRGAERTLTGEDGEELRELVEGLRSAPPDGPFAWALDRFRMGVERESEVEALSDHLLALRALLDGGRGAEPATVALRLAALCAEEKDRRAVQRRIESAFALEPFVVARGLGAARGERYVEAVGRHGPQMLVRELEDALRHLLGGILRQELDPDLSTRADEILLRSGEPPEIQARRLAGDGPDDAEGAVEPGRGGVEEVAERAGRTAAEKAVGRAPRAKPNSLAGGAAASEARAPENAAGPHPARPAPAPATARKRAFRVVEPPTPPSATLRGDTQASRPAAMARLPEPRSETEWDLDEESESYSAPV